jgi:hypothetical protein
MPATLSRRRHLSARVRTSNPATSLRTRFLTADLAWRQEQVCGRQRPESGNEPQVSLSCLRETVYRSTHRRTGAEIRGLSHSATDSRNLWECVVGLRGLKLRARHAALSNESSAKNGHRKSALAARSPGAWPRRAVKPPRRIAARRKRDGGYAPCPNPAVTLCRKDWISCVNRAVLCPLRTPACPGIPAPPAAWPKVELPALETGTGRMGSLAFKYLHGGQ